MFNNRTIERSSYENQRIFVARNGPAVENAPAMALVESGTLVLVVDDDREVRNAISDVLAMEGYEVRLFASADAAWDAIARGADPALIILDLWLPGMTSGEFVGRLRGSLAASVPLLVLTGDPAANHFDADVDAVSAKPLEAPTLVRVVDKLVGTWARRAPRAAPAKRPRSTRPSAAAGVSGSIRSRRGARIDL